MVNSPRQVVHPKPDWLRNRRTVVTELSMTIYAGACRTVRTVGDRTRRPEQRV